MSTPTYYQGAFAVKVEALDRPLRCAYAVGLSRAMVEERIVQPWTTGVPLVLDGAAFAPGTYRVEIKNCPAVFDDFSPAQNYGHLTGPLVTDAFIVGPPLLPIEPPTAREKVTVLFIASSPEDEDPLRLDREVRQIQERVRASEYRDTLGFEYRLATQPCDLLQALNETRPHVVHFSGHGSAAGLALENDDGSATLLSTAELGLLLKASQDRVRLAVFNACDSADQAVEATRHVDAAIGMNEPIGDRPARVFAGQLYSALGFGKSLQQAFDQAAFEVSLECGTGSAEPKLFTASGVDADALQLVTAA